MEKTFPRMHAFLHRLVSDGFQQLAILLAMCASLSLFSWITEEMMEGETNTFDTTILMFLRNSNDPSVPIGPRWFKQFMLDFTSLGSGAVLATVTIATISFMLVKKRKYDALLMALSVAGGAWINSILKHVIERPRPDLVAHLVKVSAFSFPSSHTMAATVAYVTLGVLLGRHQAMPVRVCAFTIAAFIAGFVGISRVYLGAHWPTDVIAGWSAGVLWVMLSWTFVTWLEFRFSTFFKTSAQA